jgi:hypothetical protein
VLVPAAVETDGDAAPHVLQRNASGLIPPTIASDSTMTRMLYSTAVAADRSVRKRLMVERI